MREVIQKREVKVILPEIVQYRCDKCGAVCGTKDNPKERWNMAGKVSHYCKKTCSPSKEELIMRGVKLLDGDKNQSFPYVCMEYDGMCPVYNTKLSKSMKRERCIFMEESDANIARAGNCPCEGKPIKVRRWDEE